MKSSEIWLRQINWSVLPLTVPPLLFVLVVIVTVGLNPHHNQIAQTFFPDANAPTATAVISVLLISLVFLILAMAVFNRAKVPFGKFFITFFICFQSVLAVAFLRNPTITGLQQFISMEILLLGPIAISLVVMPEHRRGILTALTWATTFSAILFWVDTLFLGRESFSGFHRSTALVIAVLAPYLAVANWKHKALSIGLGLFLFCTVLVSASRTATVAMVVGLAVAVWLVNRRALASLLTGAGLTAVTFLGYVNIPHLRHRFFPGIDSLGGTDFYNRNAAGQPILVLESLNPTYLESLSWGRFGAWTELLSQLTSPVDFIFGKGLGASSDWGRTHLVSFDTPLNEYLRFLVDLGVVGIFASVGLFAVLLAQLLSVGFVKDRVLSAVVPIAIMSMTESTFVYIFSVAPIALILGLEMSFLRRQQTVALRQPTAQRNIPRCRQRDPASP